MKSGFWWKILSIVLITYSILAGILVPLKPGIIHLAPETGTTGQPVKIQFFGYNSFFTKNPEGTRIWLEYDETRALFGKNVRAVNDTILEAEFILPNALPKNEKSMVLSAIIDHPNDGVSLLPSAFQLVDNDSITPSTLENSWTSDPIQNLNVKSNLSFPYRNVIYESIRNTYFHVPMWFVLLFLFAASVWKSILFLKNPILENDRKAASYAEIGLLFGFLGLFTGMIWANYAWGKPWSNDIKQLMTAVALLIYLAYFILRSSFDEPEKGARLAAVYNIFAFASLIPLLYVVPRLFASLHPGAAGSPAFGSQDLDNTMRMVFYPAIIGWTLLGFWIAELRIRTKNIEAHLLDID